MMTQIRGILSILGFVFMPSVVSTRTDFASTAEQPTREFTTLGHADSKPTNIPSVTQSNPEEKDNLIAGLEPGEFYGGITLLLLVLFCVMLCSYLCKEKKDDSNRSSTGKRPDTTGENQNNEHSDNTGVEMTMVAVRENETRPEDPVKHDRHETNLVLNRI